jgi:hypothetical protein
MTNCKFIDNVGEYSLYLFKDRWDDQKEFYLVKTGIKIEKWSQEPLYITMILTKYPTQDDTLSEIIRGAWVITEPKFGWDNGRVYT